ncbi:MAG TPA: nicotinate-nucleotide--dimethylbenzimidazole phosphoribosyltransferase, partial [Ruminococcus sp.]|nr:nicotinate-nucleotide--dimethylbenzimidazole phosphoribosyltransferase [Ruminococcus sp.]
DIVGELKNKGADIIVTGEMGIGNTTTSSAVASVLLGKSPELVTGKGSGLDEERFQHKIEIIKRAI